MGASMDRRLAERSATPHEAYDWSACWDGPAGPQAGPMGRAGTKIEAVGRVIEALTEDIPPGSAARAEIYRVNVLNDTQRHGVLVAERDATGAIRWSGRM